MYYSVFNHFVSHVAITQDHHITNNPNSVKSNVFFPLFTFSSSHPAVNIWNHAFIAKITDSNARNQSKYVKTLWIVKDMVHELSQIRPLFNLSSVNQKAE